MSKIADLSKLADSVAREKTKLESELASLTSDIEKKEAILKTLSEDVSDLVSKKGKLQTEFNLQNREFVAQLKAKNQTLDDKLSDVDKKSDELTNELADIAAKETKVSNERKSLSEVQAKFEKKLGIIKEILEKVKF